MQAYIFRHGESDYNQRQVFLVQADDLTAEGIKSIRDSATYLGQRLGKDLPVQIHSSPFGRCLHSSKLIADVLSDGGFDVADIREDYDIEEVRNFEWDLFHPLARGGQVKYENQSFTVDSSLTNPSRLDLINYFRSDSAHNLSDEARQSLPLEYLYKIATFEKYPSVYSRLDTKLESLEDDGTVPLLCTHEGLTGRFIERLTGNRNAFLKKGKYFGVHKSEAGIWVPFIPQENSIGS